MDMTYLKLKLPKLICTRTYTVLDSQPFHSCSWKNSNFENFCPLQEFWLDDIQFMGYGIQTNHKMLWDEFGCTHATHTGCSHGMWDPKYTASRPYNHNRTVNVAGWISHFSLSPGMCQWTLHSEVEYCCEVTFVNAHLSKCRFSTFSSCT